MRTTVIIKNLKCDSCKNTVAIKLDKVEGISSVFINVEKSSISFNYKTHNALEGLRIELADIGYPITEYPNTIIKG